MGGVEGVEEGDEFVGGKGGADFYTDGVGDAPDVFYVGAG